MLMRGVKIDILMRLSSATQSLHILKNFAVFQFRIIVKKFKSVPRCKFIIKYKLFLTVIYYRSR